MADNYLVLFVAQEADDEHAEALRAVAREVPGAGFFVDPWGGQDRTVGTYLRTNDLAGGAALILAVARVSEALAARIEVQFREEILGHLVAGRPDARLAAALRLGDIPDPL